MQFSYGFNKKITPGGLSPRIKLRASRAISSLLIALIAAIGTNLVVRAAPNILATMTATFFNDVDGDGKADPGDTIEYTVVIQNNGTDATGVTFNDLTGLNTTLVAGSLNISPLALDDTYDTIGNTILDIGVGLSDPAVHVPGGSLFTNDTEFLGDTYTLKSVEADATAPFTTATESGGSVTVEGDGNFSYTPPVGFTGADHFDYVLTDDGPDNILGNADDLTGAGRVTINVTTQRVWYVKNDAAAGGLGRSTDPLDTLAEAQTASAANDTIYVFQGNNTTSGQNAGIVLKNGQRLLGEGVNLTILIPSGSFNGVSAPTTVTLKTGVPANKPKIGNAAGDGVSVNTTSIGATFSGVEIRGLDISGTGIGSNAVDVTTGTTFGGSFELADNVISAAGAEGIDVNGGGSGTLTVSLHDNTVIATGNGIDIQRTAGSVVITTFDDNVVPGNSTAAGINILGSGATVLFDADTGTAGYQQVLGGNTAIGQSGNGVSTFGMSLSNVTGDISFTDLDIYADGGNALLINGTTPNFNAGASTGFRLVANTGTPTLVAVGGAALDVTEANINIVPTTFTSSITTAVRCVSLVNVSGTLTAPAGSTITSTSATGTGFFVDGSGAFASNSNVNVTYPGTITADIGRLVQIQNMNPTVAASYAFSGAITDNNDGDGNEQGIFLDNNDNGTITFSGGLTIRTTTNAAFTATNGGTVNVCDENPCNSGATGALVNMLTTTTGTALNFANTTIGSNNLEFRSISSNGAASGIVLNTTGSGNLAVKGNGGSCTSAGTCTGGTIQNSTSYGISLTNTTSPSFTRIAIQNAGRSGIDGQQVTNFTLANSFIDNVGTAAAGQYEESNISFNDGGVFSSNNVGGTVSITDNILTNARRAGIMIENGTGTISNLTISNNTLTSSTNSTVSLGNAIHVLVQGSASLNAHLTTGTISGNIITNFPSGEGILIAGGAGNGSNNTSSTLGANGMPINITGNFISGGTGANRMGSNAIRASFNGQFGVSNFNISNNGTAGSPITNIQGQGISVFMGGTVTGTTIVNNNVIVANQTLAAGTQGLAVQVDDGPAAAGTSAADYNFTITNNSVSNYEGFGIRAIARASLGKMDITIQNNKVGTPILTNRSPIRVDSGSAVGDVTVCLNMTGNTNLSSGDLTGSGVNAGIGVRKQGSVAATNDFGIVGIAATPTNAQVQAFLDNPTNSTAGVDIISGSNYTSCSTTAMLPDNNQVVAQTQPETNLVALDQISGTNVNSADTVAITSDSVKLSEQASGIDPANTLANASTTIGGGKPLFRGARPAPFQSGETVNVTIGTLPAGKSVTIQYRVTVNDPLTVGTTQISNQGTVNGINFSNVLTDDTSVVGGSDPTITPVDRPDANINSINRQTPVGANTNASSVTWRVTFDTPISGLTSSNFTLANTGLTTPSITTVAAVTASPDTQWDVTVNTGSGDGTLGLNIVNDTNLSHEVFVLPFTGQTYTIDKTTPTVTSFTRNNPATNPTNSDTLVFQVTFSEPIMGFGTVDFIVHDNTPLATTSATPNSVSSGPFRVTISGGDLASFDGVVGLDFNTPNANPLLGFNITDQAGNALANTEPATDETYTVDNSAPTVTINQAVGQNDPTNANPIVFTVVFSEAVTDFDDLSDVTLSGTASATVTSIAGGPTTYTVNVTATTNGTVTAAIPVNKAQDSVGNNNTASTSTDNTVTYDTTAPTVTINQAAGQNDPTGSSSINFTAVFSESVTDFDDATDVTLTGTAGATTVVITGGPTTYNVAVSGMSGSGTVIVNVPAGVADDGLNTNAASTSSDNTVTYDGTQPTVTINQAAGQSDPTGSSPINFTVVFSEPMTDFDDTADVTLTGTTGATTVLITGGPTTYNIAVSGMTSDGTVIASIPAGAATDGANLNAASTSSDNSVLYDTVAPSVTINQASGQSDPTNTSQINFTVVFSETVTDFDDLGDVSLTGTASATLGSIMGGPTTYNVVVNVTTEGTVIANIPVGAALDAASQLNSASTSTDNTVTYDTTQPTVAINQAVGQSDPASGPINFTVVFSEPVIDFDDATDVTLSGTAGATTVLITGGPTTYNIAVSGMSIDGDVIASIPAGVAIDGVNLNTASTSTDNTVTFVTDAVPPSVSSVNRADPSPTNATNVNFTVTFSESVTGVDLSDFTLTTTGVSGASVSNVSGSGATYNVTVNTGTGNGTVRLDVVDNDSIIDSANNPLGGAGPSNGDFTTGEVYTIVKSGPFANVEVEIAGGNQGTYSIVPQSSVRPSYTGINNGPVKVMSTNGMPIVASERVAYSPDGGTTWTSYSELIGLPANLVHTSYTFPFYNNVDLNSQLRFGNVGNAPTTITVTIAGVRRGSYVLAPNASQRVSYAGVTDGPVIVTSSGNVPIISSMRVAYFDGSDWTSFSEMMGMPTNKLTNSYVFPWYNNVELDSQLRFGNVGNAPTTVTVTIGGVVKGTYALAPNQSQRVSYSGLNTGPVKVTSSDRVPVIASMRVAYFDGSAWIDFSEMMGMPSNSLGSHYSFPVYDNVRHNSQLRFGNVGTVNTIVTVTINGVLKGTYNLAPNASQRISYAGLNAGPVVIQSSGNVPIIASMRVAYFDGSAWTSFAEMMGLPFAQLTDTFLFPWYNNVDINSQLRFGVP